MGQCGALRWLCEAKKRFALSHDLTSPALTNTPDYLARGFSLWPGWGWQRRFASSRVMFSYRCPPTIAAKARFAETNTDCPQTKMLADCLWPVDNTSNEISNYKTQNSGVDY